MSTEYYDIDLSEFIVESREEFDGDYRYVLIPANRECCCPACGGDSIIKHGSAFREVQDTSIHGHRVGLLIKANRYLCKDCKATFTNQFKSIDADAKITNRLRDYIRKESLRRPFLNIADELGMSDTTIRGIFKEYASELDASRVYKTPRILGIDENHLLNQYRAVFVDIEERKLLEMLPDRKQSSVIEFIYSFPDYEKIECVTCDMHRAYVEAVYETIPKAKVVIDKFHVVKMANEALEKIRRTLRKDIGKDEGRKLRRSRGLMLANSEDLSFERQVALRELFDAYPVFEEPHRLKEAFRDIYNSSSKKEAFEKYKLWAKDAPKYPEFKAVADTVYNWRKEIFAYFDYQYTNAVTESLNKLINDINNAGRSYSFEVLRLKCLYGTPATKPQKYDFRKYKVPDDTPTLSYSGIFSPNTYKVIERKELIRGFGVDIDELDGYVRSAF